MMPRVLLVVLSLVLFVTVVAAEDGESGTPDWDSYYLGFSDGFAAGHLAGGGGAGGAGDMVSFYILPGIGGIGGSPSGGSSDRVGNLYAFSLVDDPPQWITDALDSRDIAAGESERPPIEILRNWKLDTLIPSGLVWAAESTPERMLWPGRVGDIIAAPSMEEILKAVRSLSPEYQKEKADR
jgi:hypothetical protein